MKRDEDSHGLIPASSLVPAKRRTDSRELPDTRSLADRLAGPSAEHLPKLKGRYESPRILKAVDVGDPSRRTFVLASMAAAAGCSTIRIETENGACTCHAVCVCDIDDSSHKNESTHESIRTGSVCSCDTVCTCNSVCTCDSEGSSGGGGGGSTSYWY